MRQWANGRPARGGPSSEGLEVTVIDDSDIVGWLAAATRLDEIYMSNVGTMVENVVNYVGRHKAARIHRLNILDHGNADGIQVGRDWLTTKTVDGFKGELLRLSHCFEPTDAFVHLQHCHVGQNHPLLSKLSAILRVVVYAGTGAHNPVYRFNFGHYERCIPSGSCESDVGRP
jgi:hypothetical protein